MSARRLQALAGLAVALAGASLAGPWITSASAGNQPPVVASGWWSRQPLAQPEPDGGFTLLWALEQEQSAAAIRIDLSTPISGSAFLTLHEASGTAADQARVVACVTTARWKPANPGAYADLPASSCAPTTSLELGRDASSASWSADVTPLLAAASGTTLELVLHPLGKPPAEGLPATSPFEVHFSGASLVVDPGTPPPIAVDPVVEPFVDGSGGFTVPDPGSAFELPDRGPVEVPSGGPTDTTVPATPGELTALGPVDVTDSESAPWSRLLILAPVSAGLGSLAAFGRRRWLDRTAGTT